MTEQATTACPACLVRDRKIEELEGRLAVLEAELARAQKNSGNSSKPPSSDLVKPPRPKGKKRGKRRRGAQVGHPRHERTPFPPENIDEQIDYPCATCPDCGGPTTPVDGQPRVIQQVEVVAVPVRVSEHRGLPCWCRRCQQVHYGAIPQPVKDAGLVGPRLTSLVAYLKGACHCSFSTIRKFVRDVLVEVLGDEFQGVLGCDYFSAYRKFMGDFDVRVQFCLAHLIRDVKFLAEHPHGRTQAYGRRLLERLRELFRVIHARDTMNPGRFAVALQDAGDELHAQALWCVPATREAQNLAERFRQHGESYLRFITTPGVEPTNNLAEQAIRFVVLDRHVTQGSRSESGQRWLERIWTTIATCTQQGRSVFEFLCHAVHSYFQGNDAPSLLLNTS